MDGPGTYSQPPYAGGSKDESGTAAKDTISIGSGDRVSGEDRMGMEVHAKWISNAVPAAVSDNNQAETSAQADQAKRITIQKTPAKVKAKAKKHIVTVSWKKIKKNKKTKVNK